MKSHLKAPPYIFKLAFLAVFFLVVWRFYCLFPLIFLALCSLAERQENMGNRDSVSRWDGKCGCEGRAHYDVNRGTCGVIFCVPVVSLLKRKVEHCKISRKTDFFGGQALSVLTWSWLRLTGFCALFRNAFVFVIKSVVLALIPSVRYDTNLVLNPIIVFTAPDLEMILENKTSARPRSRRTSLSGSSGKFVVRIFLSLLIALDSVEFPSELK